MRADVEPAVVHRLVHGVATASESAAEDSERMPAIATAIAIAIDGLRLK